MNSRMMNLFLLILVMPLITNKHNFNVDQLVDNHIEMLAGEYDNGYPKEKYDFVLDKFLDIYGARIDKKGGKLFIQRDFYDGAVNAWAWRIGDEYHLEVPGGMSKYHLINEEAFVTVICHELGHLLAGAPYKSSYISAEGQSDYFATSHCVKRMLPLISAYKENESDREVLKICKDNDNHLLCERVMYGAKSLTRYVAFVEQVPAPTLVIEDDFVVNRTLTNHPSAQCRLDTLKRGFFCSNINEDDIFKNDHKSAYCSSAHQPEYSRPACWYAGEMLR